MDHKEEEDPASFSPAPQSCNWLHKSVVTTDLGLTVDGAIIVLSVSTRVKVVQTEIKFIFPTVSYLYHIYFFVCTYSRYNKRKTLLLAKL